MKDYLRPLADHLRQIDPSVDSDEAFRRAHSLVLNTNLEPRTASQALGILFPSSARTRPNCEIHLIPIEGCCD